MTDQEINEAVARKLGYGEYDPTFIENGKVVKGPKKDYCHSIEAAWEIVEHANKSLRCPVRFDKGEASRWYVSFDGSPHDADAVADTAPMAICLAFLKLRRKKHERVYGILRQGA